MWIGYEGYITRRLENFNGDFLFTINYNDFNKLSGFIMTDSIKEFFVIDDNLIAVFFNESKYIFYKVTSAVTSTGKTIKIDNFNKYTFIDFISQIIVHSK